MKRFFYLTAIIIIIALGAYFQYRQCSDCCNQNDRSTTEVGMDKNLQDFHIQDGLFSIKSKDNFNFTPSSYEFATPISEDLQAKAEETKDYLDSNPDKLLCLKGYYADFERNTSLFPDLGIARANAVKKYFTDLGISNKSLLTEGELTNKIPEKSKLLKGIVSYEIKMLDNDASKTRLDSLSKFGENLKKSPMLLYFDKGTSTIYLSDTERTQMKEISDYLTQIDNVNLIIIGHTDNTGTPKINNELGAKRANTVKEYFVKNGFEEDRIETVSKGESQPIASNDTEEGRNKNRRVELTIK